MFVPIGIGPYSDPTFRQNELNRVGGYVPSAGDLFGRVGPAIAGGIIGGPIGATLARGAIPADPGRMNAVEGGSMPTYGTNMPALPGSSGSSGLFDNLLGTVGNLSPAILAAYLGNSQRQDVMGQVGRLNDVAGQRSCNPSPILTTFRLGRAGLGCRNPYNNAVSADRHSAINNWGTTTINAASVEAIWLLARAQL